MILEITIEILADPKATYILSSIHYSNRITTTTTYTHNNNKGGNKGNIILIFMYRLSYHNSYLQLIPMYKRKGVR